MARAAYLRECSGLSFGPSLRVKAPSRRGQWAQSPPPRLALAGGSRTLDLHREPNRSPSDNLVAFPEGPTAPRRANGSAEAPVKTSPGPSYTRSPTLWRWPSRPGRPLRSRQARQILRFHAIHHVAGGDDRMGRAGAVVGVAFFYAIRRNQGDAKIAVHIGADDRLVVARNRPRERLL